MNTMNCQDWFTRTGWHCAPIDHAQSDALYVATPLALRDGTPLDFYMSETHPDRYDATDDGAILFALRGLGYALDDRRNWKGLEHIAKHMGFELTQDGQFHASATTDRLADFCARTLRLFAGIIAWEEDHARDGDVDFSLTREVEALMRRKDPHASIERQIKVPTRGGDVTFDFRWGDTYVDAIEPTPRAISSRLRKAILAGALQEEGVKLLFIVNDRKSREHATSEMAVLSQVARTVRYTDFAKAA